MKRTQTWETRGRMLQPKNEGSRRERKPVNVEPCGQGRGQEVGSERRQELGHAGEKTIRKDFGFSLKSNRELQRILNQGETSSDYFLKDDCS